MLIEHKSISTHQCDACRTRVEKESRTDDDARLPPDGWVGLVEGHMNRQIVVCGECLIRVVVALNYPCGWRVHRGSAQNGYVVCVGVPVPADIAEQAKAE